MRAATETKTAQITFRMEPQLRRLLEAEAREREQSVAWVINAALRQRYARKLRGSNGASPAQGEPHP